MAISKDTAARLAGEKVRAIHLPGDEAVLVGEPLVWEQGWVFFYGSRKHADNGRSLPCAGWERADRGPELG